MAAKKPATDPRSWPSPDRMGRVHCDECGHFTANPNRVHGWCGPGGMAAWQKRMDNAADRGASTRHQGTA